MADAPKDGGPAFPSPNDAHWCPGMSLRDWYAGRALTGMAAHFLSSPTFAIAERCYDLADALLAEREKR